MPIETYREASFLISAAKCSQLPPDNGYEIAFAGRSNAGKSTALNCITGQKQLARTSKTPGRTQLINLFNLDDQRRLVDLPGYGYAKVPESVKLNWQKTLAMYLEQRECLRGVVLLMDIRHPLQSTDTMMIEWAEASQIPLHLVLTKADKLKRNPANQQLHKVEKALSDTTADITLQLFSGLNKSGLDLLVSVLDNWFEIGPEPE